MEEWTPPTDAVVEENKTEWTPPADAVAEEAKKKYTITIQIGFWYFRINGRSCGLRSPFYFKD